MSFTLIPAYGRDYKNKVAVLADFQRDKDFEDASFDATGRYINKSDIKRAGGGTVKLRYARLTKFVIVEAE